MPIAPNDPRVASRPLTANERLADASIRHALHIERLGAGEERRVRGMLRRVHDDLVSIILDRLDRMMARAPDQTGLWTTARYAKMMARVSDVLRDGHASVREELAMSLQEIGLAEVAYQGRLISDVIPFDVDLTLPGAQEIRTIVRTRPFRGKLLREWWGEQTVAVRRNIDASLRVGLIEGESVTQIVGRIRRQGGGVLPTSRRNMGAVVRTAVNHVSTAARSETARANDDIVKGEQIIATLDSRTTMICISQDGVVYAVGKGPRPPFHPRCRTTTGFVLKSFREMGIDFDDIPEGTRAALDGEVAANVKYPEWIMRQPAKIQNEALGVRTAQLLRDGKVSMSDVIRKQRENLSRPLTLAQVRNLGGL